MHDHQSDEHSNELWELHRAASQSTRIATRPATVCLFNAVHPESIEHQILSNLTRRSLVHPVQALLRVCYLGRAVQQIEPKATDSGADQKMGRIAGISVLNGFFQA